MMLEMAERVTFDFHGLTGLLAIVLMLVHVTWAMLVFLRRDERWIYNLHKFSVVVWRIWLVPYLGQNIFVMG